MKFITGLILILFVSISNAQDNADNGMIEDRKVDYKNMLDVELGGNGKYYSLNYSRVSSTIRSTKLITRIGFEYVPKNESTYFIYNPIELYFKNGTLKHFFEFGAGYTLININQDKVFRNYENLVFARIGYSYHKPGSKFNFRAGFTPFLNEEIEIIPFGGISFGYLF